MIVIKLPNLAGDIVPPEKLGNLAVGPSDNQTSLENSGQVLPYSFRQSGSLVCKSVFVGVGGAGVCARAPCGVHVSMYESSSINKLIRSSRVYSRKKDITTK